MINGFFESEKENGKAERLVMLYAEYLEKSEKIYNEKKLGSQLKKFLGGKDEFANHPVHDEYYISISNEVKNLKTLLEQGEACGKDALIAVETLLATDSKARFDENSILGFGLIPFEQYAVELFAYLENDSLLPIYEKYAQRLGTYPLPLQEMVKNSLAEAILSKGLELPKKKSFLEKLFSK